MPRSVVVTGGSTGIGRAVAERFAADGADVVITGRRADVLGETAAKIGARGVVCDASDPAAVQAALAELPEQIDILVNNAGGNTDFTQPDPDNLAQLAANWQANFAANVVSAVLTTTALTDRLAKGGTVVLLSSIAAERGSGGGSYGAAKAAVAA